MKGLKDIKVNGMNVIIWLAACAIIIATVYLGVLPANMIGALAVCFGMGTIIVFVGDRIPIWNTFFGGGILLSMFVGSSGKFFGWLPETTIDTISNFIGAEGFLDLFIIVLIVGSLLAVDRKLLIRSVTRYIPCILMACVGAGILAGLVGLLFGNSFSNTLVYYVLPIMSGGSGAGALPLADMFSSMTGNDYNQYVSVAMATLTLGDLFAVITATVLGKVLSGNKMLCGDGRLMKTGNDVQEEETRDPTPPTMSDLANCLVLIFAVYMLATIFSSIILPSIAGAAIHKFAYAVIIAVILNVTHVLPENMVSALIYTQKYFVTAFVVVVMFCCGVAYTDLATVIQCVSNPATLVICLAVVLGATLGGGFMGKLVGFYPYEAAVTSGLCMANAGGAGDVSVLSACKRMNLMPYAQISSRIGNAIILIGGSFLIALLF